MAKRQGIWHTMVRDIEGWGGVLDVRTQRLHLTCDRCTNRGEWSLQDLYQLAKGSRRRWQTFHVVEASGWRWIGVLSTDVRWICPECVRAQPAFDALMRAAGAPKYKPCHDGDADGHEWEHDGSSGDWCIHCYKPKSELLA